MLGLVLASSILASSAPDADDRTVAVLPIDISGEIPQGWREVLSERLVQGMKQAGLTVVPPEDHGVLSCAEENCVQGLGASTGADYVIESHLVVEAERKSYDLKLRVLSARSGQEVAKFGGTCDLCGLEEGADLVEARAGAVSDVLEKLALGSPVVRFTSTPAGVNLEIDGKPAGQTPVAVELEPGSHRVRATMPGFMPQTFEIESVEGVSKELEFRMMAEPRSAGDDPTRVQPERGQGLVIAGAVLVGAGIAAIAAGGALLAIDGQPFRRRCEADGDGNCRFLYGTQTGGIITTSIGGAALIGGIGLILGGKLAGKKPEKKARLRVGPGGFALRF